MYIKKIILDKIFTMSLIFKKLIFLKTSILTTSSNFYIINALRHPALDQ